MKASDIAQYVLSYGNSKGDVLTNKKLQKLLYYIEAWNLVYFGSVIDENFEAWIHGPVVPEVYRSFREFGYSPIIIDYKGKHASEVNSEIVQSIKLKLEIKDLINEVIYKYGSLSSFQLEMLSHSEPPWLQAREGVAPNEQSDRVIDKSVMKDYYISLLPK
jgi:uncharacterized phage-associated protein